LSSFALKIIALTAMVIDHIGDVWSYSIPNYLFLRVIGRIAFPLYAFMIAEGCRHTRNIKNYALRLGAFALISEFPFDLCFRNKGYITAGSITFYSFEYQNVFFNLFLAVLAILIWENFKDKKYKFIAALAFPACMWAGEAMNADYGWFAVAFIAALYFIQNKKLRVLAMVVGAAVLYLPDAGHAALMFGRRVSFGGVMFIAASLPAVPVWFYDGRRGLERVKSGFAQTAAKYFFYAMYPLHLAALAAINILPRIL